MTNLFEDQTLEFKYDEVHDISHKYKEILFSYVTEYSILAKNPHVSFYILKPDLIQERRVFHTYKNALDGENVPASFDKRGNIIIKTHNTFKIYSRNTYNIIFEIWGDIKNDNKDLENYQFYKEKSIFHCFRNKKLYQISTRFKKVIIRKKAEEQDKLILPLSKKDYYKDLVLVRWGHPYTRNYIISPIKRKFYSFPLDNCLTTLKQGKISIEETVIANRFKKIDNYCIWSLELHFSKNEDSLKIQLNNNKTFLSLNGYYETHPMFEKDFTYLFQYKKLFFVQGVTYSDITLVQIESLENMKLLGSYIYNFDYGPNTKFVKSACFSDYSLELCIIDIEQQIWKLNIGEFVDEFILKLYCDVDDD